MSLARKSLSAGRQPRGGLRPVRGRNARNRNRKRRESRLTAGPPVEKILRQIENVRGRRRSSPLARLRRRRRRDREYCDTRLQCRFEKIRAQILSSLRAHGVECVLDLNTRESRVPNGHPVPGNLSEGSCLGTLPVALARRNSS